MSEKKADCTVVILKRKLTIQKGEDEKGQREEFKTLDSAIQRTNNYPANSAIGFPNTCPLDSDLFGG